jgi:hypothetical protein
MVTSAQANQDRSLATVGFFFGDFIPLQIAAAGQDCESAIHGLATQLCQLASVSSSD